MTRATIGIDHASVDHNKSDYSKAKAAGLSFAIIRCGYGTWTDPTAARDAKPIRDAGLVFGEYVFARPGHDSPQDTAYDFSRTSPLKRGLDLPPVVDVEFARGVAATGLTRGQILKWVYDCVDYVHAYTGCWPMLYTSRRVWDGEDADALDADAPAQVKALGAVAAAKLADNCPLWLARYPFKSRIEAVGDEPVERERVSALPPPPVPNAWGEGNWWIHQYQGDAVGFEGFSGTVDVNRFHILAKGETGPRVRWAQKKLGQAEGTPGVFDDVMRRAVVAFQREHCLAPDGIIGPRTFAALAWR